MHEYFSHPIIYKNISEFHPLFGRNMQLQNNSCFARKLDWTKMNLECNRDDIFFKSIFYSIRIFFIPLNMLLYIVYCIHSIYYALNIQWVLNILFQY